MKCPCCGGEIEALEADMLLESDLAPLEKKIITAFIYHYPRKVSREQLVDIMWPYGSGPDDEFNVLRSSMTRLRKKLTPLGWRIPDARSGPGDNARYWLERLQ